MRAAMTRAALFAGVLLGALATGAQAQTVINVTVANDSGTTSGGSTGGAGTLSAALAQINASTPPGGFIINLQTNVTLSGPLSPIFNSVSINGNGFTISGNNSQRIFMVGVDTATQTSAGVAGSIIADRPQVAISNVILSAGLAQGGGNGAGGGMGAGGALFVNQSADVTLSNVSFANNNAKGGARKLWRFDLKADGAVDLRSRKLLYDWGDGRGPDGFKQDEKGRLYVAAGLNKPNLPFEPATDKKGGIYVLDPDGKLLTFLPVPTDEVTNCAFGGDDRKTLYVTGGGTLYSIRTTTPGHLVYPPAR